MFTTLTALVVAAVFFSAVLRGMAGFGFALAAVPILSLVLPPLEAVTLAVLMQVVVGLHDIFALRRDVHTPTLSRLCLGSLLGTPIGVFALAALSPDAARVLIAGSVLGGLALLLRYKPTEPRPRHGLALFAGVASGAFSGLAAMPGPPAVAFYLGAGVNSVQTRASLFLFFFVTALIATPGLVIAGGASTQILALTVISIPALALGTKLGTMVFNRLDGDQYRQIAITVMGISAIIAGWRGLSGYL